MGSLAGGTQAPPGGGWGRSLTGPVTCQHTVTQGLLWHLPSLKREEPSSFFHRRTDNLIRSHTRPALFLPLFPQLSYPEESRQELTHV